MNDNSASEEAVALARPPRENIVRTVIPGPEIRSNSSGGKTLQGHFAVFNDWTEIDSVWEGQFMERIEPGAFKKTIRENRDSIKVLYDHGQDPSIGNKPLGPIKDLREDETGAYYEVDLLDTSYNRDLIPVLRAGLLGASFRFRVMREDIVEKPTPGDHNPRGLPERSIKEIALSEFGPVTFPAYKNATAGVRSMTDDYIMRAFLDHPDRLRALLLELLPARNEEGDEEPDAPEDDSAEPEAHPVTPRRDSAHLFGMPAEENPKWHL